jgi:hypothetical protein
MWSGVSSPHITDWQANRRILDVKDLKSVPYVRLDYKFAVYRMISAFSIFILAAYEIFRLFGAMFGEREK